MAPSFIPMIMKHHMVVSTRHRFTLGVFHFWSWASCRSRSVRGAGASSSVVLAAEEVTSCFSGSGGGKAAVSV